MAEAALFVVFLAFAVAAPLVLYALVREEAENTERMRREEAIEELSGRREDR